jgi:hypothetical protein
MSSIKKRERFHKGLPRILVRGWNRETVLDGSTVFRVPYPSLLDKIDLAYFALLFRNELGGEFLSAYMDLDGSALWIGFFLIGGLLFVGCEEKGSRPDVPAGTFTVRIDGALSDTLTGPVHYRTSKDSLTGFELGAENGPGVSIELEPQPPALRTYEVIESELFDMERPEAPPGVMAFLTLDAAQFHAVDGTLELTYVSEDRVGATFTFQMEGTADVAPAEPLSIEATGTLDAPSRR